MGSVYEYTDYRCFLRDELDRRRKRNPSFSLRAFAARADIDPGNLTKVLKGRRNLTRAQVPKLTALLRLRTRESEYFTLLVRFAHATDETQRQELLEKLAAARRSHAGAHELPPSSYEYFGTWYTVVVRELLDCDGGRMTPQELAHALDPPITPGQARAAVGILRRLGLVQRSPDDTMRQAQRVVTTPDSWESTAIHAFQKSMAELGTASIDRHDKAARDISTLTIGLSAAGLDRVKRILGKARADILAVAQEDDTPDRVYQLNLQLFPVTKQTPGRNSCEPC